VQAAAFEETLEQRAFLGALADDAVVALLGVNSAYAIIASTKRTLDAKSLPPFGT
jgi:hypothetical protein